MHMGTMCVFVSQRDAWLQNGLTVLTSAAFCFSDTFKCPGSSSAPSNPLAGDPIELGAAATVFFGGGHGAARSQPVLATAGKSWIGHTEVS